jgi:ABC-type sugar transport system substrate-binding protein
MTVRVDNAAAGAQVAAQIGKLLAESGKTVGTVLELQGMLSQEAGRQRSAGFAEYMAKNHPNIKIIKQPTDWDARKAADATQTVVSSVPIDAIYMHSDCALLPGVLSALKQTGRLFPKGDPKHIILGSIDGSPLAIESIRAKTLDFMVEQPLLTYAKLSAKYLSDAVQGLPATEGEDGKGGRIIKSATGHEHIVKATLVTEENVNDPTLWGNSAK